MGLFEKHLTNTMESIRGKAEPHAPIAQGVISNSLCLLGNISQRLDRTLRIDPKNGKILGDNEAEKMSYRIYEPGWEPKV